MKKYILSLFFTLALTALAQNPEPNVMIIHYNNGNEAKVKIENIDHLEFLNMDDLSGFEDAQNPTDKPGQPDDPDNPDNPDLSQLPDPKVGDYYYSDGTWSDGGLVSINDDGTNAVWAEIKPAPVEGKTVIGIVFNVNPDRIAASEKDRGYTRGYVIACKNITDPGKSNFSQYPESIWFAGQWATADVNKVSKLAKSCYENLEGYTETKTLIEKNDPTYYSEDIPMFYYGTAPQYPVVAPATSSGWFIPSVGQMWDCVANFCSGEVAEFLAENRTNTYDFTYYCSKNNLSKAPFETFMKVFELVPDADKDAITIPDNGTTSKNRLIELATSTRYDEESRVVINLGMEENTLVEGMASWFDEEAHARPILAF